MSWSLRRRERVKTVQITSSFWLYYTLYRKLVLICFSNESEPEPIEREKYILSNKIIKVILEKEGRNFMKILILGSKF